MWDLKPGNRALATLSPQFSVPGPRSLQATGNWRLTDG